MVTHYKLQKHAIEINLVTSSLSPFSLYRSITFKSNLGITLLELYIQFHVKYILFLLRIYIVLTSRHLIYL